MSLAAAIASSSVVNVVIGATGPKTSTALILARGYVEQDGRRVEVSLAVGALPPGHDPCAVVDGVARPAG